MNFKHNTYIQLQDTIFTKLKNIKQAPQEINYQQVTKSVVQPLNTGPDTD